MNAVSSWDFRDGQELAISQEYNNEGYIIEDANLVYLESIKASIEKAFFSYFDVQQCSRYLWLLFFIAALFFFVFGGVALRSQNESGFDNT